MRCSCVAREGHVSTHLQHTQGKDKQRSAEPVRKRGQKEHWRVRGKCRGVENICKCVAVVFKVYCRCITYNCKCIAHVLQVCCKYSASRRANSRVHTIEEHWPGRCSCVASELQVCCRWVAGALQVRCNCVAGVLQVFCKCRASVVQQKGQPEEDRGAKDT